MKQHLTVSAIPGPPVVTTIVPRIGTAIATGLAPSQKRRAQWKLGLPLIAYPAPPAPEPPFAPIAGYLTPLLGYMQEQRKRYESFLSPPTVVNLPLPPELTVRVHTATMLTRVVEIRRRPMAGVRAPLMVRRPPTMVGPFQVTQPPRMVLWVHSRLRPPQVVNTPPPLVLYGPMVRKAVSRRMVLYVLWPPAVPS